MTHKTRILILLSITLFLNACAPVDVAKPTDAETLMKKGAFVVDVRSQDEFDGGHLEGATLIPHTEIEQNLSKFPKDQKKPIVVYCRSGRRAEVAKELLESRGYTNVVNGGGYKDLKN